jgi:hypothetical protein
MSSKNQKLNLDRDTLYDLYINQQLTSKEVAEIFGCTSKSIRNYLIKYDIPVRQNGDAVKLERSKWSAEKEAERTRKFMQAWIDTPDELKQEITAKRIKNINPPEAVAKAKETKLKNGTYKISQAENAFYKQLCLFIDESDIIRGYVDKQRYPYNCDFYIKSKDLFIEYQGHQTHGTEPYDATNPEHWVYCDRLQASGYSTDTFTIRDPNKVATAKQHKINLLLIYPKNNSYLIHNGIMTSIGKFSVAKINDLC